jgi:Na+/H+ antiporter NhaC
MQVEHPYGWLSLVPPLLVIVLAIFSRRIILSLLAGIAVGALMTLLAGGTLLDAIYYFVNVHLWETLTDAGRLQIFAFTLLMGGMVGIIGKSGGMQDLVRRISVWARTRKSGQFMTWVFGLIVFFDDYANTMLLGTTMQPLCDRLKISSEKLAYLVDSTAAPVAGLALVSTWVATEIAYVYNGLSAIDANAENSLAFTAFVQSIPYRFYILWALLFVPMIAFTGRDFGPMRSAEQRSWERRTGSLDSEPTDESTTPQAGRGSWINVVIPVTITVIAIFGFMFTTGRDALGETASDVPLYEIIGNCDPNLALLWGSAVGFVVAFVLVLARRDLDVRHIVQGAGAGAQLMIPALAILWLASALSTMTQDGPATADSKQIEQAALTSKVLAGTGMPGPEICQQLRETGFPTVAVHRALKETSADLEQVRQWMLNEGYSADDVTAAASFPFRHYRLSTGVYLKDMMAGWDARWLPTIIFVLSSFVAFATGSSWGTMGIIMPLAIPLMYNQMNVVSLQECLGHPLMLTAIGSVLSGAIFGDHCSPISDTTVLSSQASGCDHMAHVVTQMPYALTVGGIAIVFGTVPVGFGVPIWVLLPAGVVMMLVTLLLIGKQPHAEQQDVA